MTYLLSSHGTVVCRHRASGTLLHRPLAGWVDDAAVVDIGDITHFLHVDVGHLIRDDDDIMRIALHAGPLAGWVLTRSPDHRSVHVSRQGLHMIATEQAEALTQLAGTPGESARFMPLGHDDLTVLIGLLSAHWLVGPDGEATRPEPATLTDRFGLLFGSMRLDLRWNLPFDRSEWPHRLTLLRDAWRIVPIFRYRPLVYFVACGNDLVIRQFALAAMSLVTAGGYDDEIVVITDKSPDQIAALFPPDIAVPVAVLPVHAADSVGYKAARFLLIEWPDAHAFQPLLYVDVDILFDLPVAPMLHAIARSDRICVVPEPYSLATSPFVGSHLLADDGCEPPPDMLGFNGGTLGIPSMMRHRDVLETIARVLHNRLTITDRHTVQFVDQPISNYVAFKLGNFDNALLARYARLANESARPEDRRGFVHYCWVPDAELRVETMEKYLRQVLEMVSAT